jgi:hypothetical protein
LLVSGLQVVPIAQTQAILASRVNAVGVDR